MKHIAVKSLLSVMLSLMMVVVFTPAIAFADEPDAVDEPLVLEPVDEPEFVDEATEVPVEDIDVDITETQNGMFGQLRHSKKAGSAKAASGSILVTNISSEYDYEYAPTSSVSFARTDPCTENGYYYVEPVTLKKGIFCFEFAEIGYSPTANQWAKAAVFTNASCTKRVGGYAKIRGDGSNYYVTIPKTGTYYVAVGASESGWDTASSMAVSFYAECFPQAKKGTTLKNGKYYAVKSGKGKTTTFKYKAPNAGYIDVYTSLDLTKNTLKSSKGKTLATQPSWYYLPYFGVKKTTYKISVKTHKKSTSGGFIIWVANHKMSNQAGSSKSKAKTLTESQWKNGRIDAGSKKSKWFKFKNPSESIFTVELGAYTNYKLKVEFYKGKSKLKKWTTYLTYKNNGYELTATDPMPVGTYYVKVTPVKKSCGVFGVAWGR